MTDYLLKLLLSAPALWNMNLEQYVSLMGRGWTGVKCFMFHGLKRGRSKV